MKYNNYCFHNNLLKTLFPPESNSVDEFLMKSRHVKNNFIELLIRIIIDFVNDIVSLFVQSYHSQITDQQALIKLQTFSTNLMVIDISN